MTKPAPGLDSARFAYDLGYKDGQLAMRERAAQHCDAKAETVHGKWEADDTIPAHTHSDEECRGKCDYYCGACNTAWGLAYSIRALAPEEPT